MEALKVYPTVDDALIILQKAIDRELAEEPDDRIQSLAQRFRILKEHKKAIEDMADPYTKPVASAENALIQCMIDNDTPRISVADKTFTMKAAKIIANLPAANRDAFIQALREQGFTHIAPPTINPNTLNSFTAERVEMNDGELPDWMSKYITIYKKRSIGMTSLSK